MGELIWSLLLNIISSTVYDKIKNHPTSGQSNSGCNATYINNGDINIHINK